MPMIHGELATTGEKESLWIGTTPTEPRPELTKDVQVDVAIVGAGIVGITAAYLLKDEDLDVAVLERGRVLEGVTGKTTAKVTAQHNVVYKPLMDRFGRDVARHYALANQEAQQEVARMIKQVGVDADYTQGSSYVYTTKPHNVKVLKEEAQLAAEIGLPAFFTGETELPFPVEGAVRFDDQAHFHPRKYLLGLLEEAERSGVTVYEGTPVTNVQGEAPSRVETPGGRVTARHVIVATHVPVNDKLYFVHRMRPKREYVLAAPDRRGALAGMYVNYEAPRRSVRPYKDQEDGQMLIIAGESHETGERGDQDHYARLREFAQENFEIGPVRYHWSTQDYYPYDSLPMVGPYTPGSKHVYAATGFRAWGMTQGTTAAVVLAGEITGRPSAWRDLYDPHDAKRVVRDAVDPSMWKTGAHVVKELIGKRLSRERLHELEPGEGQIADEGGHKVAVSRDEHGVLHKVSAKCAHMGCIVAYNQLEGTWDCPCHGARYSRDGKVLRGPASKGLEPVD